MDTACSTSRFLLKQSCRLRSLQTPRYHRACNCPNRNRFHLCIGLAAQPPEEAQLAAERPERPTLQPGLEAERRRLQPALAPASPRALGRRLTEALFRPSVAARPAPHGSVPD